MARLADKVALITGGESGIGLATARLFVSEGARVHLVGLDSEKLAVASRGDPSDDEGKGVRRRATAEEACDVGHEGDAVSRFGSLARRAPGACRRTRQGLARAAPQLYPSHRAPRTRRTPLLRSERPDFCSINH